MPFAWALYRQLCEREGNLVFSPSNLSLAMAMAYAGAEAETASEMAQVFKFPSRKIELHRQMERQLDRWTELSKREEVEFRVANRVWGQQGTEWRADFQAALREHYGSNIEAVDFSDTEQVRRAVNEWVQEQTADKIPQLLAPGTVRPDTKMILTSAVYFRSKWGLTFSRQFTADADFHVDKEKVVRVPLMTRTARFRYAESDRVQYLELAYREPRLAMVFLLPKNRDLPSLERELNSTNLNEWADQAAPREVQAFLPRFKVATDLALQDDLQPLGLRQAFDAQRADFSGVTGQRDFFLAAVLHKSFLEVTERGTEAASSTALFKGPTGRADRDPKPPAIFRADHPFIFLIWDREERTILFLGRISDPSRELL